MEKEKKTGKLSILTNGLLKENPSLRLVLGTCPTLAVTRAVISSIGMRLPDTFVLIFSNMAISACRRIWESSTSSLRISRPPVSTMLK